MRDTVTPDGGHEADELPAPRRSEPTKRRRTNQALLLLVPLAVLTGLFSNTIGVDWLVDPAFQMKWDEAESTYFLDLLLKEKDFFYSYHFDDPARMPPISKFKGPAQVSYTAFLYAHDARYPTDRILAVKSRTLPE